MTTSVHRARVRGSVVDSVTGGGGQMTMATWTPPASDMVVTVMSRVIGYESGGSVYSAWIFAQSFSVVAGVVTEIGSGATYLDDKGDSTFLPPNVIVSGGNLVLVGSTDGGGYLTIAFDGQMDVVAYQYS